MPKVRDQLNVYLAAKYSRRAELLEYREQLEKYGAYKVTSRWVFEDHDLPVGADASLGLKFAQDDVADIEEADIVIAFTEEPGKAGGRNRGGRHVELGLALARLRDDRLNLLFVVGWRENVFCYLPEVQFFETWPEAWAELTRCSACGRHS